MQPITSNLTCGLSTKKYKKKLINTKNTGILATLALGATSIRAFSNAKLVRKTHKPLALVSLATTLLHVATAMLHRYSHKHKKV